MFDGGQPGKRRVGGAKVEGGETERLINECSSSVACRYARGVLLSVACTAGYFAAPVHAWRVQLTRQGRRTAVVKWRSFLSVALLSDVVAQGVDKTPRFLSLILEQVFC